MNFRVCKAIVPCLLDIPAAKPWRTCSAESPQGITYMRTDQIYNRVTRLISEWRSEQYPCRWRRHRTWNFEQALVKRLYVTPVCYSTPTLHCIQYASKQQRLTEGRQYKTKRYTKEFHDTDRHFRVLRGDLRTSGEVVILSPYWIASASNAACNRRRLLSRDADEG